ncbi:TolC family protein [Pararcticibacter amylolyticus]|uniref:Transporter n=1 Tax=Pararcticibacter amylolyticus TaxID=2173175 RepID=A0A2U2PAT6_9SPHI|nr:TolC family protein [Pararcticibacter amylolyticus]PWG78473.1 transporter [Pararcticibacter amylolyticus]
MIYKILTGCLICICCCSFLQAETQDSVSAGPPATWDLQQCLNYAKTNNIQIRSLKLNTKTNEQNLLLAKSAVLPDLYGSASQTFTNTQGSGTNTSGSYGLNSSWTLYNGGYLKASIRQQDLAVQQANLNVLQQENDLTLQITQAYLNILLDKESIVYSQDLVNTSTAQLQQARQRYKAGSIARKDVVQFEAQLANDQYTLTSSENAQRKDLLNLKQLLQLPLETEFDIVKPDTVMADVMIPSLEQVRQYALQNRPEVKNDVLGLQSAQLDLKKANAGYKPVLSAGMGAGTSYAGSNALKTSSAQLGDNFYQQAGLSLSIPIFTKRTNKTNIEKAKISIDQAQLTLENTKTVLSQAVEQAYITAINARSQYKAASEQFKYNQEVYRIANEELRLGAANIYDFYQRRNSYVQALQSYVQAKYTTALSVSIYDFYSGIPVKL